MNAFLQADCQGKTIPDCIDSQLVARVSLLPSQGQYSVVLVAYALPGRSSSAVHHYQSNPNKREKPRLGRDKVT